MKKIIITAIMFAVLLVVAPMSVNAEVYGEWEYTIIDGNAVTITKYTGNAATVNIPATIAGLPVTQIWHNAFANCWSLTSIEIPDSVTYIGNNAFSNCTGLTSINIPNSISSIEQYVFSGCRNLTSIIIPKNVTSIEFGAFGLCTNLTSVILSDGLTSIGACAFDRCTNLVSIEIPSSVTSIGDSAFGDCNKLSTAYFEHSDALTIANFGYYNNNNAFEEVAPDFKIYYPQTQPALIPQCGKAIPHTPPITQP